MWPDGDYYQGTFVNGLKEGFGVWKVENKLYAGEFSEDMRHGYGMSRKQAGDQQDTYVGQFFKNVSAGLGFYETKVGPESEAYCGQWADGMFNGYGVYVYSDQSVFLGAYANDLKHGEGMLKQSGFD